jgi:hypothetical protein
MALSYLTVDPLQTMASGIEISSTLCHLSVNIGGISVTPFVKLLSGSAKQKAFGLNIMTCVTGPHMI